MQIYELSFQTATEDGVEFEQHSFDLLSKRLAWRDRKDALLKRDTEKKSRCPYEGLTT